MRVLIVGGGIVGLATAWIAARRGHDVELIERGSVPNPGSASHDEHRLCRIPYGDQDGYARLMTPAYAAWEHVWEALGARHYAETGCLALSTAEADWTDRSRAGLERIGAAHAILDRATLAARFPMLRTDDARYGLWTEPGGVLFADRIVEGLAHLVRDAGVTVRENTTVIALDPEAGTVETTDGARSGDVVVVAAGAWTHAIAPWVGPHVVPLRQVVLYVAPPPDLADAWAQAPIMLDLGGPRGMFLATPVAGRRMKLGCGALNRPEDPFADPTPKPGEGLHVLEAYRDRLTAWDRFSAIEPRVCHYANVATQVFHVERRGRTLVFTGCSGHAFKFGALLGFGLAHALDGGPDRLAWMAGEASAFDPSMLNLPRLTSRRAVGAA